MQRRSFLKLSGMAGLSMLTGEYVLEKLNIEYNEFTLGEKKSSGEIKIVQISDLHMMEITWPHRRMAEKINALKPDLLIITGDAIDDHKNFKVFERLMALIDVKIPKAAIMGNWDYETGISVERFREMYSRFNADLLVNETKFYTLKNRKIAVIGVDDLKKGKPDIAASIKNSDINSADVKIVLCHCPAYRDNIANYISANNLKIDYLFAGHTHGGQITPFGIALVTPRGSGSYVKGWYKEKLPHMYVNKGIGTSMVPVRLGVRPEVSIFNLHI